MLNPIHSIRVLFYTVAMTFLFVAQAFGSENDRQDLIAVEKAIAAAVVNLDFETMDRIYADEFVFYHSTGVVEGKGD